ncbi:hypothetical protein OAG94_01040 [bacterium]|nr:hypothetical protein [bacterium]
MSDSDCSQLNISERSYEKRLAKWEEDKKTAGDSGVFSGCGCLITILIAVGFFVIGSSEVGWTIALVGIALFFIASSIEEKKAKKRLEEFLKNNPKPTFKVLTPEQISRSHPHLIKKDAPQVDQRLSIEEPIETSDSNFTDLRVQSTLQKIKELKSKSRKRLELKKLHGYVYSKIEEIEKKCEFYDNPGASPSVYEGLIDWEDAAGLNNDEHRDPWFYYMEVTEKAESSIDLLDNALTGNKTFEMIQDLAQITFGKSLKTLISKDAMSLILEESINELEAELVDSYERSYNKLGSETEVNLVFSLHSSGDLSALLILDKENPNEVVETIEVKQFYNNLYGKAAYAISHFYG